MSIQSYSSDHYTEAREKFLAACVERNLTVESLLNPNAKGSRGEDLYTDIALIGRADAPTMLIISSATHGVEGYCGSGPQTGLLREGYFDPLPDDTAVLMIHAMNPYGFSHDRRVTEDNVDLNRNFMDFSALPSQPGAYADIHAHILPETWNGPAKEAADQAIAAYIEQHGLTAFQAAASEGQYHFKDGIFYGGTRPTWSNQMFASVMEKYVSHAEKAAFLDFHTGLGPYGYGELIMDGTPEQKARARAWYGDQVTDPEAGTSTSAPLTGTLWHGTIEALPHTEVTFIVIEYGTYEITRVLESVRGDNWLYENGDVNSDLGAAIKQEIKDTFYPNKDDWKDMVWTRAVEVVGMAMEGLGKDN
ncbi:MAG: M14 family metallopeptidase [Pseudomonadota bacterium]